MSKVRIKYIMELIFIFILPLLFVLCNVSIENTFVYDNEGNYQTSERSISYTPIAYTTKTIIEYDYTFTQHTSYSDWYDIEDTIYIDPSDLEEDQWLSYDGSVVLYVDFKGSWVMFYIDSVYDFIVNVDGTTAYTFPLVDEVEGRYEYNVNIPSNTFIEGFYDYDLVFNSGYYTASSVEVPHTQHSPIVQLKNILADVVQIDSTNATYNVVFDYTCIWFIMFIIWHLVYMFVDFLLHFWRKEEK